jgi:hypothetical protein
MVLHDPVDEPRLLKHCDELEGFLEGSTFDPVVFTTAARVFDGMLEIYFKEVGAPMSDLLRRRVDLINWLTVFRRLTPMLRTF